MCTPTAKVPLGALSLSMRGGLGAAPEGVLVLLAVSGQALCDTNSAHGCFDGEGLRAPCPLGTAPLCVPCTLLSAEQAPAAVFLSLSK